MDDLFLKVNRNTPASKMYEGLNVSMLAADDAACGHYRVINPCWYLNKYGANCKHYRTTGGKEVYESDIVIAQRQYDTMIANTILNSSMKSGKLTIYEVDDFLHGVDPSSPVFGIYNDKERIKVVSLLLSRLHGVTVSTQELAGEYSKYNKNLNVLENAIDFEMRDWEWVPEEKDPNFLYLMWSGGITHIGDIELIREPVKRILKKYDYVKFTLFTSQQLANMVVEKWELPLDQIQLVPPVSFHEYPKYLGWADIILSPVINNRFNASKSSLRYLELASRKVPGVFSVSAPYSCAIKNGYNGFTATTPKEWEDKISYLIDNPDKRKEMGAAAYKDVRENHDMDKQCHLWPKAWKEISEVQKELKAPQVYAINYGKVGRNDPCPCSCGYKYKNCSGTGERYLAWK